MECIIRQMLEILVCGGQTVGLSLLKIGRIQR